MFSRRQEHTHREDSADSLSSSDDEDSQSKSPGQGGTPTGMAGRRLNLDGDDFELPLGILHALLTRRAHPSLPLPPCMCACTAAVCVAHLNAPCAPPAGELTETKVCIELGVRTDRFGFVAVDGSRPCSRGFPASPAAQSHAAGPELSSEQLRTRSQRKAAR